MSSLVMQMVKEAKVEPKNCKIRAHDCSHEYQDKKYGNHMRVFNKTKNGYRCTVCGKNEN